MAERQAFDRDGFVVVPEVLTPDELNRYGSAVDAAVRARVVDDDRPISEKPRYEQTFPVTAQLLNAVLAEAALVAVNSSPTESSVGLEEVVRQFIAGLTGA